MSLRKVAVIIGTTGVGKSKLSVLLAQRFNGEIVNADSLQVYSGYPIITNQIPAEERLDVPHHLLSFVSPDKEYSVLEFERDAIKVVRWSLSYI